MKNTWILILLFIAGCATVKTTSKTSYKDVAVSALGSDPTYVLNDSKTYVLCVKETPGNNMQPQNTLSFVVIRVSDNKIVLEKKINGGTVGWYDDDEVEAFAIPGIMGHDQTNDDYTTLYNVITGGSSPKKGRENK